MSEPWITCSGATFGGCELPAFVLRMGQLLHVRWVGDEPVAKKDEEGLVDLLTGRIRHAGMSLRARPVCVPTWVRCPWKFRLMPSAWSAVRFLRERGVSAEQAELILRNLNINSGEEVYRLGAAPKRMLGIAAAMALSPVVLFSTGGLDPAGVHSVRDWAQRALGDGAAIEIHYPEIESCNGYEGSELVEVRRKGMAVGVM